VQSERRTRRKMLSRTFVAAAAAVLLVIIGSAHGAEADVPSLNKETFAEAIKGDLTLVKFFAPWCGHCKSMKTDYEDAAAALKGKAILAEVDATEQKELAEEWGVRGFPTIKLFSHGEELSEYKGARDKDSFVKYMERATLPSIDELADAKAVDEFVKNNSGKTLYIATKLDKLAAAFKKQSMSVRDSLPDGVAFGSVKSAAHVQKHAGKAKLADKENVLVIRDDGTVDVYAGSDADLDKFVKTSSIPLVGELSRSNAQMYTELGLPLGLIFQDPKNKDEDVLAAVREIAAKHRSSGKLAFAWLDASELKAFMDHLGIADKKPAIAVYNFETDAKFVFEDKYSKAALGKFFDDFVDGKLKPAMKSEPIPEKNDEPVKIVVGDTWATIVEDDSKDVLIEQYAPWCGHCKTLAPVLDTVAKALQDGGVDTIVIAKMDATTNDAPPEYKGRGFPTLHFFPAGGKPAVEYSGDRSKEDFIQFFKKHATHKFKEPTFPEEPEDDKAKEGAAPEDAADGEAGKAADDDKDEL
jgi:protein disulfide-isomerase A1